jgi:Zn-finger nucleic acid-binding protein
VLCPNENTQLQQVKTDSFYGQTVILDQCPDCGGIWFDSCELYMPKQGEANKIELLNLDNLRSSTIVQNDSLLCPRDRTGLIRFIDPFFPKDLILARCQMCNGFWLNRGEFIKYQKYRQNRQARNKPKEIIVEDNKFEHDLIGVFEQNKTQDSMEVLGKVGSFLSIPVDSATWRPQKPEQLSEKERNAFDLIMTTISLIFRLFVRI